MRKEVIQTGKTVESAIEAACEQLGCAREDCEWEIIDLPKKGLFGLKNTPAKVKVGIEVAGEEKPAMQQKAAPQVQRPVAPAPNREPQKAAPAAPAQPRKEERPARIFSAKEREELTPKVQAAGDYIASILKEMQLSAEISSSVEEGGAIVNVNGDGLGTIIGRRGETLDALQYLASLVANRGEGEYLRLTLDCGDYRLKRKATLETLAAKLSAQVMKTNISKTLEPMNPFERRIIHAAVSEIEGVNSSSVGEEPNRRVVITSPTSHSRPPRSDSRPDRPFRSGGGRDDRSDRNSRGGRPPQRGGDRNNYRGGDRPRDGGGRPPRTSAPQPQGPPKATPESEANANSLYSKLDLD